jgi:membrane fusion protein, multidrug efflux system
MKKTSIILALIIRISALTKSFSAHPGKRDKYVHKIFSAKITAERIFIILKTQRIISNLLMIFAVYLLCAACTAKKEAPKAKPPVPVTVAQALQKDVPVQVKAIGTVEAFTSVAIKSQVSGQIARLHFQEGSDVEKGALLISIDPEPFQATVSQYEAALAKDQAQAKFAREQVLRYEGLLKEGIVTRDQYELLQSNAASLAATVVADHAAIKNARIQLGYCSIRSPISGRTGTIALQPGNLVRANDLPIVTVNQLSPIYVTFSLPEKLLAEVKRAMAAGQLKIEAVIPNEPGSMEVGTISFLDNSVNPATGTIKLKGVFANKSHKLWPGQFTDVLITLASRQNAVVVPTHAIQTSQQGEFVYVVKPDNTVEMRQVTSAAAGEEAVIEKGLAAGETVVVDGQLRLTPGATVESKEKQPAGSKK